jgi:bacteriorhodopsin
MSEVDIGTLCQGFVAGLSFLQFIFFFRKYQEGRCNWEALYMGAVETVSYSFLLAFSDTEGAIVHLGDGSTVTWIRYAGWMVTCPVLLIMLTNIAGPGIYDLRKTMLLIVVNQLMTVFGVSAAFITSGTTWAFFSISCVLCALEFLMCYFIFAFALYKVPEEGHDYLKAMRMIMFVFWSSYAVYFVLGSDMTGVVNNATISALHAISDIFAKNLFSLLSWTIRFKILNKEGPNTTKALEDEESDGTVDGPAHKTRVLLIEEEDTKYECIMMDALEDLGDVTVEPVDPEDARRTLRNGTFDLLIVNATNKDASGFTVADKVRQASGKYRSLPILAFIDAKKLDAESDSEGGEEGGPGKSTFTMTDLRKQCSKVGIDATVEIKRGRVSADRLERAIDHLIEGASDSESEDERRGRGARRSGSRRSIRDESSDEEAGRSRRSRSRRSVPRDDESVESRRSRSRSSRSLKREGSARRTERASSKSSRKGGRSASKGKGAKGKGGGDDGIRKQSSSVGRMLSFFDGTAGQK